jgi:hypothetical protein
MPIAAKVYEHEGEPLTVKQWAGRLVLSESSVQKRLRAGETIAEIVATPRRDTGRPTGPTSRPAIEGRVCVDCGEGYAPTGPTQKRCPACATAKQKEWDRTSEERKREKRRAEKAAEGPPPVVEATAEPGSYEPPVALTRTDRVIAIGCLDEEIARVQRDLAALCAARELLRSRAA